MENTTQLAKRFKEVLLDGKWIANTNYQHALSDITWQQATTQVGSLNTIAALTFHINYYIGGVLQVLEGGTLDIRDKYSFDMPAIQSESDWNNLVRALQNNATKFAAAVAHLPEEQLEQAFVKKEYGSYRRNIEGMIEHCYYHLGQISLLKKLVGTNLVV